MTTPAVYAERRARLAAQLGAGGVAIIPTAPARMRNRDSDYLYRHDSYFFYLTGFTEPNAWLVITAEGRSTLLCQPKDLEREIWDGIRLGPDAAPQALGVDEAHSVDELDRLMPVWLENRNRLWYPFATHSGLETHVERWLGSVRAKVRQGVACPTELMDACGPLDEMRLVKDAHELNTMRRACDISAAAHIRAMQTSARRLRAGQDLREFHLDAELLHGFREAGSQYPAYGSIVAGGANACVLHYRADAAPIRDGDLVLIDAGCELDGYASDITRTFPANGRFTGPQRTLYDIVLAAQEAAVNATRVGARFVDPHNAAVAVLAQGMLDVGLLDRNTAGTVDDVIEHRRYTPFYMHRTGHWLGMDVHDCGAYTEVNASGERVSRSLQAGMVLTIEPGIYVRPAENVPEAFWNIGIRIEDDAVVTPQGCELISRGVPVDADAIEALMRD
jgi:Xaa-Pro aminopeptidase